MVEIQRERVIDMSTKAKTIPAVAMMILALMATASPSLAGRYRTPTPQQAQFYEDLKSGKRPVSRKILPLARRRALEAAPKSTAAPALASPTASAVTSAVAAVKPSAAVYFTAHPDDFVLFMNPYLDVARNDTTAIFVFVTAGDAGLGKGPTGAPYYAARENGALRAIRFMADVYDTTVASPVTGTVKLAGHSIRRVTYKNTVTYFLRLPDGAVEGVGYPISSYASLMKLKTGETTSMRAVDGSTTYKGWNDLVATLTALVRKEAAGSSNVWLDVHEADPVLSPGDHSDHQATGLAVSAIQPSLPCTNIAYYVGYATSGLVNLDLDDIENRSAVYGIYVSGVFEKGYPGSQIWEPGHKSWLAGMNYRLVPGNGAACTF